MISELPHRRFPGLALVCFLSVGFYSNAYGAPLLFRSSFRSIETGRSPSSVATADLEGSGKSDIVVTNRGSNTITLLKGFPGTPARLSYPVGAEPTGVALTHVTGDARPDAVVSCSGANSVTVLPGAGPGFDLPGASYAAGPRPAALVVADFNGDGRADIGVTNYTGIGTVSVLLANGSATFDPPVTYGTAPYPRALAMADFDSDGDADLVAASYGYWTEHDYYGGFSVTILAGNGDGTFAPGVNYPVGARPAGVAVGDLDRDGHLDIVTASEWDHVVSVLRNSGDGTFAPATNLFLDWNTYPGAVALANVNADPHLDVVVGGGFDSWLFVLPGQGDGTFGDAVKSHTGAGPSSIASDDLDGDGRRDLAVTCAWSNAVVLMTGNGDGSFGKALSAGPFSAPRDLAAADLDGDGVQDMVVGGGSQNYNTGQVWVLRGLGDGHFGPAATYGPAGTLPRSVTLADFDRDGHTDIGTSDYGNGSPNTNCFLRNIGGGGFQIGAYLQGVSFGWSSEAGDLNGDGFADLAVTTTLGGTVQIYSGSAQGLTSPSIDVPGAHGAQDLCLGDFNGDARLDIGLAHASPQQLTVLLSNGNGSFTREEIAMERSPLGIVCGHFDGDDRVDLAVLLHEYDASEALATSTISIMHGLGDGTFVGGVSFGTGPGAWKLSAGDVNTDGIPDLLTANTSNTVSLLLGQGDGTFPERADYGAGNNPQAVTVADVNGDLRPDLLVANTYGNDVSVLLNETPLPVAVNGPGLTTDFVAIVSNPALDTARIEYALARAGHAHVEVTDVRGRRLRVLTTGAHTAGHRSLTWDGRDSSGRRLPHGVYFVTLHASGSVQSRKLILLRR